MTDPGSTPDRPARILIVDDEPFNVDYLEQELECHGFLTESAFNGLEALERVAADPPDLVLLDVMMPELDGISALRMLKQDPQTRLIPVVLMTALNAVEDRVRGIEAGADDFLSKPVDERELLARITTALRLKRAIDETVGELRSTSEHLERYGSRKRAVAVLALEWRLRDPDLPETAVGFLGRRERSTAEALLGAHEGVSIEIEGDILVAVFDGPDLAGRSTAAIEAALAIRAECAREAREDDRPALLLSAAIAVGPAQVGSARRRRDRGFQWAFVAEGEAVERASEMARGAADGEIVVAGDVAAAVNDRFRVQPAPAGGYTVLAPSDAEDEAEARRRASSRRIATLLVTDVVGSTTVVARAGDRAGGELLASLERVIREELALFGGVEIDTAGDSFLASFDSPARAIRCAHSVVGRAPALGLAIRAGIHTGELEDVDGKPRGIAVHVAHRIAAKAAPGEVLVGATTRALTTGAGLAFSDRGVHALKGVAEPEQLFAAVADMLDAGPAATRRAAVGASRPAGLSAREVDVLRLVASGLSDAEVAERLFLSVRTVNAHLRSIYRKAGVRSRAAAGRFAEENGLV